VRGLQGHGTITAHTVGELALCRLDCLPVSSPSASPRMRTCARARSSAHARMHACMRACVRACVRAQPAGRTYLPGREQPPAAPRPAVRQRHHSAAWDGCRRRAECRACDATRRHALNRRRAPRRVSPRPRAADHLLGRVEATRGRAAGAAFAQRGATRARCGDGGVHVAPQVARHGVRGAPRSPRAAGRRAGGRAGGRGGRAGGRARRGGREGEAGARARRARRKGPHTSAVASASHTADHFCAGGSRGTGATRPAPTRPSVKHLRAGKPVSARRPSPHRHTGTAAHTGTRT
jgi:hypothetical protein